MGWLLAILLALICGLLAILLILERDKRLRTAARLRDIEATFKSVENWIAEKHTLVRERDDLARSYLALRNESQDLAHAQQERDRILAEAERYSEAFNARVAEAQARYTESKERMEAELAAQEEQLKAHYADCKANLESDLGGQEQQLRERIAQAQADYDKSQAAMNSAINAKQEELNTRLSAFRAKVKEEMRELEADLVVLRAEHEKLHDDVNLRDMGFYEPRYSYATSVAYQAALDANLAQQEAMVKGKTAAICTKTWKVGGSLTAGRKHSSKLISLMLRAFNGECDAAISKVRYNNFTATERRINRAFAAINKLGEPQACQLAEAFRDLKLAELQLSYEHAQKIQAEREEQQDLKEQMRQEALAAREHERAKQEAEKEEHRRQVELQKTREEFERAAREQESEERQAVLEAKLRDLEQQLAEAHETTERVKSLAEMTKAGHVYVISNIGAFGENVFKIGMTRRFDPMDRIWELSDASVPFDFDVHAIIRTDDAPALEWELHQRFADRRLNVVNERKEFFHVTIDEIAEVVRANCGDIELTLVADASEFFQSEAARKAKGMPLIGERKMVTYQPSAS